MYADLPWHRRQMVGTGSGTGGEDASLEEGQGLRTPA